MEQEIHGGERVWGTRETRNIVNETEKKKAKVLVSMDTNKLPKISVRT